MKQRLSNEEIRSVSQRYATNELYVAISKIGDQLEAELTRFGLCTEECFLEVMEVLSEIAERGEDILGEVNALWFRKHNEYRRLDRMVSEEETRKVVGIVFGFAIVATDSSQAALYRYGVTKQLMRCVALHEFDGWAETLKRIAEVPLADAWFDRNMLQPLEETEEETAPPRENLVFKDNVDVDKVMERLNKFANDKLLKSQKHWYIAYRVFMKKAWLRKTTQTCFIKQMNADCGDERRCTDTDFKKVDRYFKDIDYTDWTPEDRQAPQCCADYKDIAIKLDREFQDEKYAKPGTTINTRKIIKLG